MFRITFTFALLALDFLLTHLFLLILKYDLLLQYIYDNRPNLTLRQAHVLRRYACGFISNEKRCRQSGTCPGEIRR